MKRLLRLTALFALCLAAGAAFAQRTAQSPAPAAAAASKAAPAAPHLTEVESLRLENLQLRAQLLQQQFQQSQPMVALQSEFNAFVEALSAEHPGWRFDPRTQAFVSSAAPAGTNATPQPAAKPAPVPGKPAHK